MKLKPKDHFVNIPPLGSPTIYFINWIKGIQNDAINDVMKPGKEAELLRNGIEKILSNFPESCNYDGCYCSNFVVIKEQLRYLVEATDAGESLTYLENKKRKIKCAKKNR